MTFAAHSLPFFTSILEPINDPVKAVIVSKIANCQLTKPATATQIATNVPETRPEYFPAKLAFSFGQLFHSVLHIFSCPVLSLF
jgi:hypothetical protein